MPSLKEANTLWYRRGLARTNLQPFELLQKKESDSINGFISSEIKQTAFSLINLNDFEWLTDPRTDRETFKLEHLKAAANVGILIPDTIVTNNKDTLISFALKYHKIIAKPIYNMNQIIIDEKVHLQYTTSIDIPYIQTLDKKIFPSIFQEKILKEFEIRVFYLDGKCYSMAIFSQNDSRTKDDFRIYNEKDPNRIVPFKLPNNLTIKIRKLMNTVGLLTGSIDLIKTKTGEYFFLEINSVGQFGLLSKACNYKLEKEIAQYLIKKGYEDKK